MTHARLVAAGASDPDPVAGGATPVVEPRPCDDRLPYGAVRVGPAGMAFGFESLATVGDGRRRLFEQTVAACRVDPDSVLQVRVSEAGVEVDVVDFDDPRWPVRTVRHGPCRR